MRITSTQLRQIVKEELMHSMKTRSSLNESFKAVTIGAATGINSDAIESMLPLFAKGKVATDQEAVAIANKIVREDYEGDVEQLIKDFKGAIGRADIVKDAIKPFVREGGNLNIGPVKKVIEAISSAAGRDLSGFLSAIIKIATEITGKPPYGIDTSNQNKKSTISK